MKWLFHEYFSFELLYIQKQIFHNVVYHLYIKNNIKLN
jgi:hypothetical protein